MTNFESSNIHLMKFKHLFLLMAVAGVLAGCKSTQQPAEETVNQPEMEAKSETSTNIWDNLGEEPVLKIETTEGTLTVKLYSLTPLHRDNFIKLARKGFYNDILFHRIIKNFMIQCGDPLTKDSTKVAQFGTGGPGYTIPAEIVPGLTHKKGALAAARRGDSVNPAKESSGSQFYIVQDEQGCKHLDGEYTIFGEVTENLEIIDKIAAKPTDQRDRPLEAIRIISISPVQK